MLQCYKVHSALTLSLSLSLICLWCARSSSHPALTRSGPAPDTGGCPGPGPAWLRPPARGNFYGQKAGGGNSGHSGHSGHSGAGLQRPESARTRPLLPAHTDAVTERAAETEILSTRAWRRQLPQLGNTTESSCLLSHTVNISYGWMTRRYQVVSGFDYMENLFLNKLSNCPVLHCIGIPSHL